MDRIQSIAEYTSQELQAPVIAFLVHDSDVLCYWLYDCGKQLDEYNSCPGYWGDDDEVDEESLAADCNRLLKYCRPGTDPSELEKLLAQWLRADVASGVMPSYTYAEDRLRELAPLLGLPEQFVMTDYNDIGRDMPPEEVGAIWVGSGEQAASDDTDDDDADPKLPPAPLLAAV